MEPGSSEPSDEEDRGPFVRTRTRLQETGDPDGPGHLLGDADRPGVRAAQSNTHRRLRGWLGPGDLCHDPAHAGTEESRASVSQRKKGQVRLREAGRGEKRPGEESMLLRSFLQR